MKKLYKFLRTDLKSDSGNKQWKISQWEKEDNISICNKGFHASKTPLQALGYVAGEILAEVEVRGDSVKEDDKECWSEMRIVKAWHWKKKDSVALSVFAAELCIKNYEKKYPDDLRPRNAIEAAKKWLAEPTEENVSAARSAESAAWSAARSAGESAAWSAARSAARSAESAAWSAGESAAWSAAESAARSAVSAARSAARSAGESAESARKELVVSIDRWFLKRVKTLQPYE